ncbi:MAG: 4Fe-4S binding protein [Pseudomonadota bacterium]
MSFFKMTKTVLKGLFSKPATVAYPMAKKEFPVGTRGAIINHLEQCIYCGICDKKCPTNAIKVVREPKSWKIDHLGCIQCHNCVEICPKKCLEQLTQSADPVLAKNR